MTILRRIACRVLGHKGRTARVFSRDGVTHFEVTCPRCRTVDIGVTGAGLAALQGMVPPGEVLESVTVEADKPPENDL